MAAKFLIGTWFNSNKGLVVIDVTSTQAQYIAQGMLSRGITTIMPPDSLGQALAKELHIPYKHYPNQLPHQLLPGDMALFMTRDREWHLYRHRGHHSNVSIQLHWVCEIIPNF